LKCQPFHDPGCGRGFMTALFRLRPHRHDLYGERKCREHFLCPVFGVFRTGTTTASSMT